MLGAPEKVAYNFKTLGDVIPQLSLSALLTCQIVLVNFFLDCHFHRKAMTNPICPRQGSRS